MPEPVVPTAPVPTAPVVPPVVPPVAVEPVVPPEPVVPDLRDEGKKAIDSMKAERNAAKAEAQAEREKAAALQAKIDGKEAEHAAEKAQSERDAAALEKANDRIRNAEVRRAATGRLHNPSLALKLLDLTVFEVDDEGGVDEAAIEAALAALLLENPGLAAQGGQRFPGGADGGARNESTKSIDERIDEASKAGNHALAIHLKREKAYAATP